MHEAIEADTYLDRIKNILDLAEAQDWDHHEAIKEIRHVLWLWGHGYA